MWTTTRRAAIFRTGTEPISFSTSAHAPSKRIPSRCATMPIVVRMQVASAAPTISVGEKSSPFAQIVLRRIRPDHRPGRFVQHFAPQTAGIRRSHFDHSVFLCVRRGGAASPWHVPHFGLYQIVMFTTTFHLSGPTCSLFFISELNGYSRSAGEALHSPFSFLGSSWRSPSDVSSSRQRRRAACPEDCRLSTVPALSSDKR